MKYDALLESIASLHVSSAARAALAVNQALILRNWVIGAYLIEFEQQGEDRAAYGEKLLPNLARDLAQRGVPGASQQMLDRMRSFYRTYPQIDAHIRSSAMSVLPRPDSMPRSEICSSPMSKSPSVLPAVEILRLSWTHIIELLRLEDPWKRAFYENECLRGNWSVRCCTSAPHCPPTKRPSSRRGARRRLKPPRPWPA